MNSGKKKLGLALGGGSARGFAHIGVLKVLEEAGISADMVAGTSMGAVIGAFYCSGISLRMIERLAAQLRRSNWLDWTFPRMGLATGDKVEQIISLLTKNRNFDELEKPLAVVATDLCNGERVVINDGNVARAVRASAAIPGIFCPVEYRGRTLVDGAVVERVPVQAARQLGADMVIAVDVGIYVDGVKPQHIFDVISQSLDIMQRDSCRRSADEAEVVIRPQLQDVPPSHFHKAPLAIQAGADAAWAMLPQIREIIRKEEFHAQDTANP